MRGLLLLVLAAGCAAPPVTLSVPETEAGPDAAAPVEDGYVQRDGRVCSGSDEDEDGIPNICDDCPNIPNVDQAESHTPGIGTACRPGAFDKADTRDPFESFEGSDLQYNFFTAGLGTTGKLSPTPTAHPDRMTGGNFDTSFNMAVSVGSVDRETVVLTTIASNNVASDVSFHGVLLRASLAPISFLACEVGSDGTFALGRAKSDCDEKQCSVEPLASANMPPELRGFDKRGIRMSLSIGESTTLVECRVFSLKDRTTLFSSNDATYTWSVSKEIPNAELPPGLHIGYFAQGGRASFYSSDLLQQKP
ncbi:MAG: thrombospondin type 3 repeat-containing protein [Polyangiales bacterium]